MAFQIETACSLHTPNPRFLLPTAAGAATAETSSAKTAKASATTTAPASSSATEAAEPSTTTTASPIEDTGEENPEKNAAQRSEQQDQYHDNDQDDAANRKAGATLADGFGRSARHRVDELNSSVVGNDLGDLTGDQQK